MRTVLLASWTISAWREGRYLGSYPAGTVVLADAFGPDGLAAYVEMNEMR